jgi:hypothetical protein
MKRYFIILTLVVACATLIYSCIGSVENTESLNTENAEKQSKEAGKKIDSTEITHGEFASRVFKVHTVDEFGEETDEVKIGIMCLGKFSNSATTNSEASLQIAAYPNDKKIYFALYEYNDNTSSTDDFSITLENENGETLKVNDRNFSKNYQKVIDFMGNSSDVKIKMNEICEYCSRPTTAAFRVYNPKEFVKLFDEK